jgi:hypothetical protein
MMLSQLKVIPVGAVMVAGGVAVARGHSWGWFLVAGPLVLSAAIVLWALAQPYDDTGPPEPDE